MQTQRHVLIICKFLRLRHNSYAVKPPSNLESLARVYVVRISSKQLVSLQVLYFYFTQKIATICTIGISQTIDLE